MNISYVCGTIGVAGAGSAEEALSYRENWREISLETRTGMWLTLGKEPSQLYLLKD